MTLFNLNYIQMAISPNIVAFGGSTSTYEFWVQFSPQHFAPGLLKFMFLSYAKYICSIQQPPKVLTYFKIKPKA